MTRLRIALAALAALAAAAPAQAQSAPKQFKFDFGTDKAPAGWTAVTPDMKYTAERGFGFDGADVPGAVERAAGDPLHGDLFISDKPYLFSVKLPEEGNWRVKVTLGDPAEFSETTVKAELRRLMVDSVGVEKGKTVEKTFLVNTRTPLIEGERKVRLKEPRESVREANAWDDRLTLEFNGSASAVSSVEIEKADGTPVLYLLGDSTMTDQDMEPWNSWGQMITRFFDDGLAVANHGESGESYASSIGAGRVDKVMSVVKPGDFVMMQFGHNDMKNRAEDALDRYKESMRSVVKQARDKGATPVLVTSMERKGGANGNSLGQYPQAVRDIGRELQVPVIDLWTNSKTFYQALGDKLDLAFVDGTHHNGYGSHQLAKMVIQGIKDNKIEGLSKHVVTEYITFDPANPDAPDEFAVPASPGWDPSRAPLGN